MNSFNKKPGGGGLLQYYIPAGNGKNSGQYVKFKNYDLERMYNLGEFNPLKCRLVGNVERSYYIENGREIPKHYTPNSVIKKIINNCIITERYYNENGDPYLDIDYTNHGNKKHHPVVPHIHRWNIINGKIERGRWEVFI